MRDLERQMEELRARQAAAWVNALLKPGAEQHPEFIAWLKESPLHVREFLLAYAIEASLEQLDSQRRIDVDALLAQIHPQVASLPLRADIAQSPRQHANERRHWLYKAVASLAGVGIISWVLLVQQSSWEEFGTGTGEQRALQLEDGSVVHLNAHSRIALNFSDDARDVKLIEGEALFEVHHDERRPFRVFTRDAVIRDIGTRFNVYSRADGIKVAVIEGSVELTATPLTLPTATLTTSIQKAKAPPEVHIIEAAQQAQVDRAGTITVGQVADIAATTAWWQRRLVYRNETLAHIVEDFNRYNRRRIRLEGDAVMQRAYTGVFDADDPESLAQVLGSEPELIVEHLPDMTIVIRAR